MSFSSEAEMSSRFRDSFAAPITFEGLTWVDELDGVFGIPDYVVAKATEHRVLYVVSFELKLRNWKRGLVQVFRYRSFSNEVFLVLDHAHISPAVGSLNQFIRANVGLASYNQDREFHVHWAPQSSVPFSGDFSERAVRKFYERTTTAESCDLNDIPSPAFTRSTRGRNHFQKAIWQISGDDYGLIVIPSAPSNHFQPSPNEIANPNTYGIRPTSHSWNTDLQGSESTPLDREQWIF